MPISPLSGPAFVDAAEARPEAIARPGLRRRLAAAFAAKLSWVGLQLAQQFFLVPVFLHYWGPERYGDWIALFSVASTLTLLELGLKDYYANCLLIAWARRDRSEFDRTLRIGLGLLGGCAFVGMALSLSAAWLVPWTRLLNLGPTASTETIAVLIALGLCVLARLPLGLAFAVYRARGDQATGIVAETMATLVQFIAVLVVLQFGGNLAAVASAYAATAGIAWLGTVCHLRTRYPDLRLGPAVPRRRELRSALAVGPYFAVLPAAMNLQVYGVVLLAAALSTPATIVVFTTLRTLTGAARIVVSHLGQAVATELARQHSELDFAALARLYAFLGRLVGGASGGIAGLIAVVGPALMSVWTLGKVPFDPIVFWSLLAAGFVTAPAEAADKLLSAINRPRRIALAFGTRSILSILACLALVPTLGATGVALAVFGADLLSIAWMLPREAAKESRLSALSQIATTWSAAALAFAVSAAIALGATAVAGDATLREIIVSVTLWAVAAPTAAVFILFDRGQRRDLFTRMVAAVRRGAA